MEKYTIFMTWYTQNRKKNRSHFIPDWCTGVSHYQNLSMTLFVDIDKNTAKFIWKDQGSRLANFFFLTKKNEVQGIILHYSKDYYLVTFIKTVGIGEGIDTLISETEY